MNLNLQTNACDPERLESFLSGALSDLEEREFALHLNTCENCRRSLQHQAAEPEAWMEAEKLLRPAEFDAASAEEVSDSASQKQSTRQPLQIQNVLAALGPTDDPEMLGRLGGYEVSGVVGAGGMGVVLKAIDKSLDRTVAIKVLAPHLATSGAARKRFTREAKAAAAVLHPNVIAIHSVSNDESLPYLVMPYVRGTSLQKRLDREGPLSLQEILRIGSQIAAGLAAAHAQGLVHRDIKPANILLEDGVERVTITDFGLARAVDDATITHSGMIAGTPQYMSPEQARGEAVDGRSDLFSLGSVLYAICTGRPPFRAETTYGVMRRITDDEPASIRELNADIPPWLCSIIARLMSKRAADRFASAAEVMELLEKCLAHVQQPAAVPLPASLAPRSRGSRFFSISRRSLGVIAMVAAFGLGLLGMVLWQASEAPDISGKWTGPEWGDVVLAEKQPGEYAGTYTDTFKQRPGTIELKWSRLEGRYKGTWREGKDRSGKISVRLVDGEIQGAWTTSKKSNINPGTPELAGLLWQRSRTTEPGATPPSVARKPRPSESGPPRRVESGDTKRPAPLEGIVTGLTDQELVEISIGADDGVRARDSLNVFRDNTYLGKITVTRVAADKSVARVDSRQGDIRVDDRVSSKSEEEVLGTPDSSLKGGKLRFSETKEVVLSMGSSKFMLDLDTGKTMDPPATAGRPEQKLMDVHTDQVQPYHYPKELVGVALEGREVKESDWDASAGEVRRALAGDAVGPLKHIDLGPEKHPTYFFKTRDGAYGVLQLLELVDEPKGIRLRYKTVETGPAKQSSADEELEKFQGTWVLVSSEKDGEEKSEVKNPYGITFTGTHWKVNRGDEVAIEGTLKLVDVTSTPMKFDLLKPKGLGPDPTVDYGIYEWKANTLRYCVRNGPVGGRFPGGMDISKLRPSEFATKNGDGTILYVWKRAGEGKIPGTVDSSLKEEVRFSDSKELVLSMDSLKFMLDLDTGKTMDPPATIRPEQEQMDLQTDQVQPYHYPTKLTGRGLVGLEVKASDWDASAAEVRLALTGKAVETLKEMDLGPEKNPTYFFKTRDGTLGILQLMELEEKPKGIRLRYKTMGLPSDRPAQGDEGNRDVKTGVKTDAAHPPSGASRDPLGSTGAVESPKDEAKRIVEQMRGISMQLAPRPRSDGKADPKEECKQEIMDQLRQLGAKAVPALVLALSDSDVQMRRNAELVMIHLAGPYSNKPRIDIKEALPALLKATEDPDSDVRAWAAHAIAEIGPGAKEAVPALIKLLQGKDEGGRNTSCMALGAIGPAAKDALPALRNALDDPSQDVRKFAQAAIKRIELPADAKAAEGQKGIADPNSVAKPKWARHLGTVEGLKSIACSPDGKLVAVANGNVSFPVAEDWKRAVVLLDGDTGKTVLSLPLATKDEEAILAATEGLPHIEVGPLAFSPDGTLLAVGTGLGQVKLFDPRTGELVRSLDDEQAKLDEKKTPEKLKSLKRAMGGVGALAFSPDSSLLAMCGSSFEDVARNWGDVRRLGRLGTGPGRLKVWDVKAGTIKHDLVGHSHAVAVSFSADGNLLASAGRWADANDDGNGVIIWNSQTGKTMSKIVIEANSGTHAVVFSPTNKLVAIGSRQYDKENDTYTTAVSVAYALSGITQWKQTIPGWANPKAFSPDGKTVVVLCGGESIRFIKTETGEVQHEIKSADFLPATPRQGSQWFDFAISPAGPRLAIGGVDKERKGSVEIWSLDGLGAAANPGPAKDAERSDR